MAISINWATKVISVPQADLTNLGGGIYEMDIDVFRLALKDLEDDEAGIPFLRTHNHNAEVTVAGTTLARVVEIINGYTVTFEDGQYAVNLVGANSNIADVANVNQVSIRTQNAAGLIVTSGGGSLTAAQVWQRVVEGGFTAEQILRLVAASVAGKLAGAETDTITITGLDGATPRIVADVDDNGNRTAITYDES